MISSENNIAVTDRIAAVDVVVDVFPRCIPVLIDAGFAIVGSLASRAAYDGVVRLLIRGSALPKECATALYPVEILFQEERYGKQKLWRVQSVEIVGPPIAMRERAA